MRVLWNKICIGLYLACLCTGFFIPTHIAWAEEGVDVGLIYSNFRFSKTPLIAGETVRFYVALRNAGNIDSSGTVSFYIGSDIIGHPIPFSSVVDGAYEEVWIDFIVPDHEFNVSVEVRANNDSNISNNSYISPRYQPLEDSDRDAIADANDNCPLQDNVNQQDTDNDGKGDICDAVNDVEKPKEEVLIQNEPNVVLNVDPVLLSPPPINTTIVNDTVSVNNTSVLANNPNVNTVSEDVLQEKTKDDTEEVSVRKVPSGSIILSPHAHFSYERIGWNVYSFSVSRPVEGTVYAWEISDGRTHIGQDITFHFRKPGTYTVRLVMSLSDGTFTSEEVTLQVSFFHLQNPWLSGLLVGLLVLCIAIMWQGIKNRKEV